MYLWKADFFLLLFWTIHFVIFSVAHIFFLLFNFGCCFNFLSNEDCFDFISYARILLATDFLFIGLIYISFLTFSA
jgi:hypothetical protein